LNTISWKKNLYLGLFLSVSFINIVANGFNNIEIASVSKVFIMPFLLFFYLESLSGKKPLKLLVFAFVFSWIGDIFLIFQSVKPLFFILGMAAFLLAQLLYFVLFYFGLNPVLQFKKFVLLLFVVLVLVGVFLFKFYQLEYFESLKIPVSFYAIAIALMTGAALSRSIFGSNDKKLIGLGALLFLVSDTLIGINKFFILIPFSGLWIMSTYIAAQFCFVSLKKFNKT